jgi:hypothetical protein
MISSLLLTQSYCSQVICYWILNAKSSLRILALQDLYVHLKSLHFENIEWRRIWMLQIFESKQRAIT